MKCLISIAVVVQTGFVLCNQLLILFDFREDYFAQPEEVFNFANDGRLVGLIFPESDSVTKIRIHSGFVQIVFLRVFKSQINHDCTQILIMIHSFFILRILGSYLINTGFAAVPEYLITLFQWQTLVIQYFENSANFFRIDSGVFCYHTIRIIHRGGKQILCLSERLFQHLRKVGRIDLPMLLIPGDSFPFVPFPLVYGIKMFFIVIDHKVNPVCDRIDRIRFESDIPLQVGCCVTALFQFLLIEIRPLLICFDLSK